MKEGWTYKKLGEIVVFDKRFKGVPKEEQIQIVSFKHVSAETLKGLCVDDGDVKLLATGLFVGYTTQALAGDNLNSGEVISLPTGGNANIKYHKGKFVDSGNILCVAKDDSIYLKYVHYDLLYQNEYIESCYKGTGIHHPYMPDIWEVKVPIPDLSTQYSIVARLDASFAYIDTMKANAEKAFDEAKALFQASLKEMLEPKEGWEEKTLEEIAQIKIGPFGSLLHKSDYILGGVPLVNPIHMVNGHIAIDNNYTISESKAKELSSYRLKENDIVFARRGEIGRCALVGKNEDTYLCGTGSLLVRFNQEVDYGFMLLLFQSKYCKEYLVKQATGATMLNINSAIVGNMTIKYPHIDIQQSIVDTLDSLKSKVDKLQANCDKISQECDALKQAMLREVFE